MGPLVSGKTEFASLPVIDKSGRVGFGEPADCCSLKDFLPACSLTSGLYLSLGWGGRWEDCLSSLMKENVSFWPSLSIQFSGIKYVHLVHPKQPSVSRVFLLLKIKYYSLNVYTTLCLCIHSSMNKESKVSLECSHFHLVQNAIYICRLSITDVNSITSHSQIIPLWMMTYTITPWGKLF